MASLGGVSSGDFIRPWRNCTLRHFPEAASQTFKKGDPLIQDSASTENRVKIAGDNPTSVIVGIAAEDATGVTGNKVGVFLAEPHAEFVARGDATTGCNFTQLFTAVALEIDATNAIWRAETDDAGNDSIIVLEFRDPVTREVLTTEGGTDPLVVFRFKEAATVYGQAG
jgi:hypothetical protein